MTDLRQAVGRSVYPGRGIMLGQSADGRHAVCAYFIMGRSVNSRNRIFVRDGEGIRTQAHDLSKLSDPSLILYAPVRVSGKHTIVTNGDQTDTIHDRLLSGGDFFSALQTRTFEPDAPNYTPRISGLITLLGGGFSYKLSILKSAGGDPASCLRFFFAYDMPLPGLGHFLHTYAPGGDPLPSFTGEPEPVSLAGNIDAVTEEIWQGLDEGNKVSLFVRFIDVKDGTHDTRIVNKYA